MAANPCFDSKMAMVSLNLRLSPMYSFSMILFLDSHSASVCSLEQGLSAAGGGFPGVRGASTGREDMMPVLGLRTLL